jgi:hypothetical protein
VNPKGELKLNTSTENRRAEERRIVIEAFLNRRHFWRMKVMLRRSFLACAAILFILAGTETSFAADEAARLKELNSFWREVKRSVRAGDFDGYQATCHQTGVLVSGTKKTTKPLTEALAGWKQGFLDTKAGLMKASL